MLCCLLLSIVYLHHTVFAHARKVLFEKFLDFSEIFRAGHSLSALVLAGRWCICFVVLYSLSWGGKNRAGGDPGTGSSPRGIGFSSWRCSSELAGAPSLFRRGLSLCGVHLFWHILVFPLRQTEKSTTASCHRALFFWVYGVGPPMYGMLYSNPAGSGITPP